jgi:hypothetical protein
MRLTRRQPETGHLEVFRADSAQHVWRCQVQEWTWSHNGSPFSKGTRETVGEESFSYKPNLRAQRGVGFIDRLLFAATYAATAILIRLGLASSRRGSRTVSTPALYWALTLLASTVGGSVNVRANAP